MTRKTTQDPELVTQDEDLESPWLHHLGHHGHRDDVGEAADPEVDEGEHQPIVGALIANRGFDPHALRFLIRDRDTKFSRSFDEVVRSEGVRVRAPNANAYTERVIETIRAECLDWSLIQGRRHLDRTLRTYATHYNHGRPHRGLDLATPLAEAGEPVPVSPRGVRRRDLLGGLVHEYHGLAA